MEVLFKLLDATHPEPSVKTQEELLEFAQVKIVAGLKLCDVQAPVQSATVPVELQEHTVADIAVKFKLTTVTALEQYPFEEAGLLEYTVVMMEPIQTMERLKYIGVIPTAQLAKTRVALWVPRQAALSQ